MSEYIIDIDLLKKAVNSIYRCALDQEKVDIDLEHAGEVVRCKDCIHRMKRSDDEVVCELRAPFRFIVSSEGYCDRGEKSHETTLKRKSSQEELERDVHQLVDALHEQ